MIIEGRFIARIETRFIATTGESYHQWDDITPDQEHHVLSERNYTYFKRRANEEEIKYLKNRLEELSSKTYPQISGV